MAVQVFLVIGGYLAVQGLRPQSDALPLGVIVRRYRRLVLPYLVAIMLAVLAAWLARHWMNDEAIPAAPELPQVLAHVFLLQGLLGYDSLSAGVWYIALDFQLFVVMTLLLWLGRKSGDVRVGRWLVVALLVASLFHFNRDESWDDWAWYFFGAYGLGAVSDILDKPGEVQGLTFELFGDGAAIALALDDADIVQGTPVTLRTAIIETNTYTILDAPVDWLGTLDTMVIVEDGQQASIRVTAESKAVNLLRGTPQFYNDADQRAINPATGCGVATCPRVFVSRFHASASACGSVSPVAKSTEFGS
jgi:hypothetical protein